MAGTLKRGDKVMWNSSSGESKGRVVKKQTRSTAIKGHKVAASTDDPQYIIESEATGKRAAHKPKAIKKL